ncbi:hypothetical protein [Photorhabdus khanii]|nr:hypothetical protein [Photorhabdus khanii]
MEVCNSTNDWSRKFSQPRHIIEQLSPQYADIQLPVPNTATTDEKRCAD